MIIDNSGQTWLFLVLIFFMMLLHAGVTFHAVEYIPSILLIFNYSDSSKCHHEKEGTTTKGSVSSTLLNGPRLSGAPAGDWNPSLPYNEVSSEH